MRVLMLGWEFPPRVSGGLGTACAGLTHGLAARGARVLFVTPRDVGVPAGRAAIELRSTERVHPSATTAKLIAQLGETSPLAQYRHAIVDSPLLPYESARDYEERLAAIRAYRARLEPAPRPARHALYGASLFAEVERYAEAVLELARREPFDVIHAHDWMTFPAALLVRAHFDKPLVCHVHATEFDRAGSSIDEGIRTLEQQGFDGADRIVCVSHYTQRIVLANYVVDAAKTRVVPNAVQALEAPRRARALDAEPLVLFVGRLTSQKGPEHFIAAARLVLERLPHVHFALAGTGELLPRLIGMVRDAGLSDRIHFTGFLEAGAIDELYHQATLLVMPSESEPFGIVALEAMQRGVPVILSTRSGAAEELSSGLRAEPRDSAELAGKILAVLRFPALRTQLAFEGEREVGGLTWDARAGEVLKLYAELAG